ncbi:hypothetical protein IWX65_003115 [Arthrobacter sp. CAN_A214]
MQLAPLGSACGILETSFRIPGRFEGPVLLVLSFRFFFGLMSGLLLMLLQLRFGLPPTVDDSSGLFSSGMAVFPLPGMIVHPGPPSGPFVTCATLFAHTVWSHEAPAHVRAVATLRTRFEPHRR